MIKNNVIYPNVPQWQRKTKEKTLTLINENFQDLEDFFEQDNKRRKANARLWKYEYLNNLRIKNKTHREFAKKKI